LPDKSKQLKGQKKTERQPVETLFSRAMTMPVPGDILKHSEMWNAQDIRDCRAIEMREKKALIRNVTSPITGIIRVCLFSVEDKVQFLSAVMLELAVAADERDFFGNCLRDDEPVVGVIVVFYHFKRRES
jgi:hypothetical protein